MLSVATFAFSVVLGSVEPETLTDLSLTPDDDRRRLTPNGCPNVAFNVDFGGNDLNAGGAFGRVKGHLPNWQACRGACEGFPGCNSWTYVKTEPAWQDNCALKRTTQSQGNLRFNAGCCDSGEPCRVSAQQAAAVDFNVDYGGNDLNAGGLFGRVRGHFGNWQGCRNACENTAGCKSWTFVKSEPWPRDNCAVKRTTRAQGNLRFNAGCCDSGEPRKPEVSVNTDFGGNDLNAGGDFGRVKGHLPNWQSCRGACEAIRGCNSWTFVKSEPAGRDNCAVKRTTQANGNVRENAGCCDSGAPRKPEVGRRMEETEALEERLGHLRSIEA